MSGIGATILCELTRVDDDMLAHYIVEDSGNSLQSRWWLYLWTSAIAESVCLQQMFHVRNLLNTNSTLQELLGSFALLSPSFRSSIVEPAVEVVNLSFQSIWCANSVDASSLPVDVVVWLWGGCYVSIISAPFLLWECVPRNTDVAPEFPRQN